MAVATHQAPANRTARRIMVPSQRTGPDAGRWPPARPSGSTAAYSGRHSSRCAPAQTKQAPRQPRVSIIAKVSGQPSAPPKAPSRETAVIGFFAASPCRATSTA